MQFHYSYCFYIHNSYLITKFTLQMVLGMDLPCHPVDFQATQRPRKEHGLRCENSHWILWDQQSADDTDSKSLHTILICGVPVFPSQGNSSGCPISIEQTRPENGSRSIIYLNVSLENKRILKSESALFSHAQISRKGF